jgi:hypothetical protein
MRGSDPLSTRVGSFVTRRAEVLDRVLAAEAIRSVFGIDALYGIDIFWIRPLTTSLEMTAGSLGSAWVFEPRATMGVVIGSGEVYAGYDALWIGSTNGGPTANLGGPVVGLRAYF